MTLNDNITGLQCSGHLDFRIEFKLVNFYLFIDIIDIKHPLGKTSGDLAEFGPVFYHPKITIRIYNKYQHESPLQIQPVIKSSYEILYKNLNAYAFN